MNRRRRAQGFTLIEVMIALSIIAGGAVAIIGMQRTALRANFYARLGTVALANNQSWISRARRDLSQWTVQTPATAMGTTTYFQALGDGATTGWFAPENAPEAGIGIGNLVTGAESENAATDRPDTICTLMRASWVINGEFVRVDVISWWVRPGRKQRALNTAFRSCTDGEAAVIADLASNRPALSAVRGSVVVGRNAQ